MTDTTLKIEYDRSMEVLGDLHESFDSLLRQHRIPEDDIFAILLGIEEIFTNFVKYNADGKSKIEVEVLCHADRVVASVTDFDSHRFDPREAPPVTLDMPLHQRKPGGLGIHIVLQMMNDVAYSYRERTSKVIMTRLIQANGKNI